MYAMVAMIITAVSDGTALLAITVTKPEAIMLILIVLISPSIR